MQTAIESLTCMTHRGGGIAADGKTGDGCGLLIQSPPKAFLYKAAQAAFGKKNLATCLRLARFFWLRTTQKLLLADQLLKKKADGARP